VGLVHISELLAGYLERLEERRKRYSGLTSEQIMDLQVHEAAQEFKSFAQMFALRINRDTFDYWLEANYPWLFADPNYKHRVWSEVAAVAEPHH
jgi:hypothetical protein